MHLKSEFQSRKFYENTRQRVLYFSKPRFTRPILWSKVSVHINNCFHYTFDRHRKTSVPLPLASAQAAPRLPRQKVKSSAGSLHSFEKSSVSGLFSSVCSQLVNFRSHVVFHNNAVYLLLVSYPMFAPENMDQHSSGQLQSPSEATELRFHTHTLSRHSFSVFE